MFVLVACQQQQKHRSAHAMPSRPRTTRRNRGSLHRRLQLEPLENRCLLTTAPFEFSGDALDPSFGDQGAVLTPFGDTSVEIANAIALDGEGRIVLAGSYVPAGGGDSEFALARYNPDGSLDSTFGTGGRVTTDLSSGEDYVLGMVLDAEGRIVVAGAYNGIAGDYGAGDFAVARYTSSGSLDESFSSDGWTNVDFYGLNDEARGIGIDSQGRLIAAGQARNATDSYYEMAVARLTPDGILDAAFSGNGRATAMVVSDGANGCGLAIDASDRIVVVGQADWAFAVARFTDTGALDPTFAGDGALTTDLTLSYDQANRVAVQPDGKIVVAGEAGSDWGLYSGDFGLVRLLADGSRDSTFGDNGQVLTNFMGLDVVTGLALDADDRIVAVGGSNLYNQPGTPPSYALARYLPDGALDPSFGTDGKIETLIGSFSAYAGRRGGPA